MHPPVPHPGSAPAVVPPGTSHVLADLRDDRADLAPEEDQGDDRDDRDQGEDECVLGETLTVVAADDPRPQVPDPWHDSLRDVPLAGARAGSSGRALAAFGR